MDENMKIDAKAVRRLRMQRAWSQEQLAASADVSLRTIQRAEADGSVSNETCMALAAVFGIEVHALLPCVPVPQGSVEPVTPAAEIVPVRYRVAGILALLSIVALLLSLSGTIPPAAMPLASMLAVATTLYAVLGWYFSGQVAPLTPARRTAQFGFIFGALALSFASFSAAPRSMAVACLQATLFACAIRHVIDWHRSRTRRSGV